MVSSYLITSNLYEERTDKRYTNLQKIGWYYHK